MKNGISIGEKRNFEPIKNFAHTIEFLTLLILLPLYLLILIIQILIQADNHKQWKSVATKKV